MDMQRMVRDKDTGEMRPAKRTGRKPGSAKSPCPSGQVRDRKSKDCRPKLRVGRPSKKRSESGEVMMDMMPSGFRFFRL